MSEKLQMRTVLIALILAIVFFLASWLYDWLMYTVERNSLVWAVTLAVMGLPFAIAGGYLVGYRRGRADGYSRGRRSGVEASAATIEREFDRAERVGNAYAKGVETATKTVMGLAAKVAAVRDQAAPKRPVVALPSSELPDFLDFEVLELGDGSGVLEL